MIALRQLVEDGNMPTTFKHGWKPDLPDQRDFKFELATKKITLPSKIDLRPKCPSVLDQGQLGSCTANAIANAHKYDQLKQQITYTINPSRLFIYYNERAMEGTISSDAGASIRDGIKSIAKQGVCSEAEWPYNIKKFKNKPSKKCYTDALQNISILYRRVTQDTYDLKYVLSVGYPIVFGFTVYESFESKVVAKNGIVPMPAKTEKVLGGHAVLMVGYDDDTSRFIVMNSWGPNWGMGGFFTMPYDYVVNNQLASDFWTVEQVK